jgi:hypothetical protein
MISRIEGGFGGKSEQKGPTLLVGINYISFTPCIVEPCDISKVKDDFVRALH